jgi:UPF0755 protein
MSNYQIYRGYRRKSKKWMLIPLVVLLATPVALYFWYKNALGPVSNNSNQITYSVKSGDTPNSTTAKLKAKGLIKDELAFKIFIKLNNYDNLLPGEYQLSSSYSARQTADIVFNSDPQYTKITFLPGQNISDYKQVLLDAGYISQEVNSAFNAQYTNLSLADKPADQDLEGYIRPETYTKLVKSQDSPEAIIRQNLAETDKLITDDFRAKIAAKNLNIHQAFTLASIIQQESSDPATQKKIAQVFYSRLDQGISLGSDPTFKYAAKMTGQTSSPSIDSPYNTRIYTGLPPGPIGSFTDSAIDAVLNPVEGDYIFFVAGDDGNTYFSRTNEEHEALKQAHCKELCQIY